MPKIPWLLNFRWMQQILSQFQEREGDEQIKLFSISQNQRLGIHPLNLQSNLSWEVYPEIRQWQTTPKLLPKWLHGWAHDVTRVEFNLREINWSSSPLFFSVLYSAVESVQCVVLSMVSITQIYIFPFFIWLCQNQMKSRSFCRKRTSVSWDCLENRDFQT